MLRSRNEIENEIASTGYNPANPTWEKLQNELLEHVSFWSNVNGLTKATMETSGRGLASLKAYLEVDRLSYQDWFFLTHEFAGLVNASADYSDLDEGVRLLKDFLHLEEGKSPSRAIRLSDYNRESGGLETSMPLSYFQSLHDDQIISEADYLEMVQDYDWKWASYVGEMIAWVENHDEFKRSFPPYTAEQSIENLRKCVSPLVYALGDWSNPGADRAIHLAIRYVKQRRVL